MRPSSNKIGPNSPPFNFQHFANLTLNFVPPSPYIHINGNVAVEDKKAGYLKWMPEKVKKTSKFIYWSQGMKPS